MEVNATRLFVSNEATNHVPPRVSGSQASKDGTRNTGLDSSVNPTFKGTCQLANFDIFFPCPA